MKRLLHAIGKSIILLLCITTTLLIFNEYIIYYMVLRRCSWPELPPDSDVALVAEASQSNYMNDTPVRLMILADTHLLGHFRGHWFDKLRREWQMYRSFQTALQLHQPDAVFVLGDLLDEGQYAHQNELFNEYVHTFRQLFNTTGRRRSTNAAANNNKTTGNIPMFVAAGNHDIGFHYRIYDAALRRFDHTFSTTSVRLLRFRQLIFVLVNSMAMEEDGCSMCAEAEQKLEQISQRLQCSILHELGYGAAAAVSNSSGKLAANCPRPISPMSNVILMQHFPLYRASESAACADMQEEADAAPVSIRDNPYTERKDCLSKTATHKLLQWLKPRAVFSGHTHHGCFRLHEDEGNVREWSVASFSWRNRINPNFLMASATRTRLQVNKCYVPYESTVIALYIFGIIVWAIASFYFMCGGGQRRFTNVGLLNCCKSAKRSCKYWFSQAVFVLPRRLYNFVRPSSKSAKHK